MDRRHDFQIILEGLCPRVYFQPPPDLQMQYPAIVYKRDPARTNHADNRPYSIRMKYEVTLISRNPDDSIRQGLMEVESSTHISFFVADNLNHDVFSIYF